MRERVVAELETRLQEAVEGLVASGRELGLQAAVYLDGELAAEAWAGRAGPVDDAPAVGGDTLFTAWSTTKGFVATCAHILADRQQLEYDKSVADYWPEFGKRGKDRVTVRQVLNHTAGVPHMPAMTSVEMLADWDGMCGAIADLEPLWEPGTTPAYHALTFGWIVGEIVRRIDGRSIATFAAQELCEPLGIPEAVTSRVADLVDETEPVVGSGLRERAFPLVVARAESMNLVSIRRASIPGCGGIMNARSIARHYAMLAAGGKLSGLCLLRPQRVAEVTALQTNARDKVMEARNSKSMGYMLGGNEEEGGDVRIGSECETFGHPGHGGSIGFADPTRGIGFGLMKNRMTTHADRKSSAAYQVSQVARDWVDGIR